METAIYLATADGLSVITRSNGNWHGEVRLKGKQVQCVAAGSRRTNNVYCGTFTDGVFRSGDGGATWHSCGAFAPRKVMSLAVSDSDNAGSSDVVYAGTEPSAMFRSNDSGETWRELPSLLTLPSAGEWSFPPRPETHHVRYILPDPAEPRRLHVAIEAGALLRSEDGGQTWRDRVPGGPKDTHTLEVHPNAPERLYSAAGDGYFESTDNGETWRRINDGLEHDYCWSVALSFGDPDTILLTSSKNAREAHLKASANSFVYRRCLGEPWREVRHGLPASQGSRVAVVTASAIEPGVFYLSAEGDVYRSDDRGVEWRPLTVEWADDSRPHHAVALALVESY
jgi:photosystem II stability/assembly factor-like uncharacterized protein